MDARRLYTTAGVATKKNGENGEITNINIWNGTVLAYDDEMARTLTLGAMLVEWPMKDGWEHHEAFVRRVDTDVVRGALI
jgi:hypothetical protein